MLVAWEAEDGFFRSVPGCGLLVPNLTARSYFLQRNRLARSVRKVFPTVGENLFYDAGKVVVLFLMWLDDAVRHLLCDPHRKKIVYIFDAWAPQWTQMEQKMRMWRNVSIVFFASRQACEHFSDVFAFPIQWCPQAADPATFSRASSANAFPTQPTILNIGRPNRTLAAFFDSFSRKHGFRHIVQSTVEGVLFPTRTAFAGALARSSIVVVHPRNLDSPEVTGAVSTLTARYYEAYNSGGIVCGFKPTSGEFDQVLSGYPFLEFQDERTFEAALLHELSELEKWKQAKYNIALEHSWDARALTMMSAISRSDLK